MGYKGKIILLILFIGILIPFYQIENKKKNPDLCQSNMLFQGKEEISELGSVTPQSAASSLTFVNDQLLFKVDEKGYLSNIRPNLLFANYYHLYQANIYLSINDDQERLFSDFTVVETLHNLTMYDPTNSSIPLVAETTILHPSGDVYVKIQYKLYPGDAFFISTFYVYSPIRSSFKAELFYYMDLDIDGVNIAGKNVTGEFADDYARFGSITETIYIYDPQKDHYIGWSSPIDPDAWEVGDPTAILTNISNDTLSNNTEAINQNCAAVTKYSNTSITVNQTWTLPIVFGFGTGLSNLYANTYSVKNELIHDFSVLNIIPDESGSPAVFATILNGGMYTALRNVSLFSDNIYLTSQNVYIKPGEYQSILFSNLDLIIGSINVIRVQVENVINDFDTNDYFTLSWMYQKLFSMKIQDFDLNNLPNVNVSFYLQGTSTFITSRQTNSIGNISIYGLNTNDYTVVLTVLWWNNEQIASLNISYPTCGDYLIIQTNITTLRLHITDIEGFTLNSIGVSIYRNNDHKFMFANYTDSSGNITFRWLRGNYDIHLNYTNYDQILLFSPILDFLLNSTSDYMHSIPMTRFILHFKTRNTQEPLVNAKIEFYNRTTDFTYGEYVGYLLADINGNVSILWANFMNYSFRVIFYSEYKLIGDPESNAFNLTSYPFLTYQFAEINVTLQVNLEEYTTELVRITELPLIYSWENNISIQFLFNVTGPIDNIGPQWADYTEVIIRNDDLQVVFNGSAEKEVTEIGLHSFILNTTCGVFTSGNPAIYHVQINALLIGYSPPSISLDFSFKLYKITTRLTINQSSVVLYWNDNVTVQADFFDTLNERPIVDADLTISWESYLFNEPMQSLGNGSYICQINSSLGSPSSYNVYINAEKPNYNSYEQRFLIKINEVPTTVNGTLIFDSIHEIYVTMENLTLQYLLLDSARTIPIIGITPDYQIINEETGQEYIGTLNELGLGFYQLDPSLSLFPIGNYHGVVHFYREYYITSYATFRISIVPIPTTLNDSTIQTGPYVIYCQSDFRINFTYRNSLDSSFVSNALSSFQILNQELNLNATYEMEEISTGLYEFDPNSLNLQIGTYVFNLHFQKLNYSSDGVSLTMIIREIPTSINNTEISGTVKNIFIASSFSVFFNFQDIILHHSISQVNATFHIIKTDSSWILDGILTQTPLGLFLFDPDTTSFSAGMYRCYLSFDHVNYTDQDFNFFIVVKEIPMNLDLFGNALQPITTNFSIFLGENLEIQLDISDTFGVKMTNCTILFNLSKEGKDVQGEFRDVGNGIYQIIFPKMESVGTYTLSLVISAQNHSDIEKTIFIEVAWQKFLGFPVIYWMIFFGVIIAGGIVTITNHYIREALVPPVVKKLNWLEKEIKREHSLSSKIYVSKEEVFQTKFADRWTQLDLEHPFVPISPRVKAFIDIYEEHTGKSLFVEEAIHYMEDLSIYSQNEILARLKADGIPDNRIFIALQTIESYIQESNSEETPKNNNKIKEAEK